MCKCSEGYRQTVSEGRCVCMYVHIYAGVCVCARVQRACSTGGRLDPGLSS